MWFKQQPKKNRRLHRGHVLDVKLRSEQVRASRVRLAVMAVSIPAFMVFALYLVWRVGGWTLDRFIYDNPEFAIQRVEVQTDGAIPADSLRQWCGVNPGANLIKLDLGLVKRNLEFVPQIDTISIERVLPRTLKIRVTERHPVAQVNVPRAGGANGVVVSVFQLDAAGMVMSPLDPRQRTIPLAQMKDGILPVIGGVSVAQLQAGHRVTLPQAQTALEFITAFNRSTMAGLANLRNLDVSSPGVIIATTGQGGEITFGLDNLQQQLVRWREIFDQARSRGKVIVSLDLAAGNNVPLRLADVVAAPATTPRDVSPTITRRRNV